MEVLGAAIGSVLGCGLLYVPKKCKDHTEMKKNTEALTQALEKLNCQKVILEKKLDTMVDPGKIEIVELVKLWLENVEKMNKEIEEILDHATNVKLFSRGALGKLAADKKRDVDNLCEEGDKFREDGLVRELPQRGIERPAASILMGESTTEKTRDEIIMFLSEEKVTRIGLYGMGGIGKSTILGHVHNSLLKHGNNFDKVILITASKDSCVQGLQVKIAREFGLEFSKNDDEERRAAMLFHEFRKAINKRFVLIINDLWEAYPLETVGIPNPTPESGCKLVVATRSRDICCKMNCEPVIQMGFLTEHEALNLFMAKVGMRVASDPALKKMAVQAAKECAGLPLAIVTVAASLRDKTELAEWRVLLAKLKDATASISSDITATLRFSYDLLKNEKLKECLLYCGMYAEDYLIKIDLLIDQLIAVGIVEEARTWQFQMDSCKVMLNQLIHNCLLIDTVNWQAEKCVKLHDSVRDMVIQIMRESPSRFLVETGARSDSLKPRKEWNELHEMVSFIGNKETFQLHSEISNCPKLSTLLLNEIPGLENLSDDFFKHMKGLRVLDLSQTSFSRLPSSVSSLSNLALLLLTGCKNCCEIPDLSELRNLVRLDLVRTRVDRVPKGVEKMAKLRYLNLSETEIRYYEKGLWRGLSELRYLSISVPINAHLVNLEDLATLRKLETLRVSFVTREIHYSPDDLYKLLYGRRPPIILPKKLENLYIERYPGTHLGILISFENITNLKRLHISNSILLEYLVDRSPAVFQTLQNIKELELRSLFRLRGITLHGQLPLGAFSSLKKLTMVSCSIRERKLFVVTKDASFPDLEEIVITYCPGLDEIMVNENEDTVTTLPSLKKLTLEYLHSLKSVPFVADSLSTVVICHCRALKKVVFLETEPRPSSLRIAEIDAEPWKSLAESLM